MTRRQMLVRASVFGFSLTAAGQLLAACGGRPSSTSSPAASGSAAPEPVMGGTLIGIIPPSITDMDPVTIYDQGGIVLIQQVSSTSSPSTTATASRQAWPRTGRPTPTARVWTFKLRQGVTFNDGSPFEAADVVASLERVRRSQERLRRPLRPPGHPVARRHQGRRHLHGRVHARQAVRRLPVPRLPVVVQHGHPAAQLQRRLRQEPGRHRPVHAQVVQRQAEGRHGQEPHLLGQGRPGPPASVPRPGHVDHGRRTSPPPTCSCSPAPSTSSRRRCSRARRRCSPTRTSAWTSTPAPVSVRSRSTSRRSRGSRRRQGAPPGRRLLPRPQGHQRGPVRRPQQPRLRHLLGADGVPRQPHPARARAGLRQGQGAAHRPPGSRAARRSS